MAEDSGNFGEQAQEIAKMLKWVRADLHDQVAGTREDMDALVDLSAEIESNVSSLEIDQEAFERLKTAFLAFGHASVEMNEHLQDEVSKLRGAVGLLVQMMVAGYLTLEISQHDPSQMKHISKIGSSGAKAVHDLVIGKGTEEPSESPSDIPELSDVVSNLLVQSAKVVVRPLRTP